MVHGWMDIGASFQFMVDALADDRWVIAPDLRGFGGTQPAFADSFWFADYLADLDAILQSLVGDQPIDLLGHSLGGHIATTYAGVRPNRIRRLVNLEGFGLASTRPSQAPGRYAQWLDEIAAFNAGEKDLKTYESLPQSPIGSRKPTLGSVPTRPPGWLGNGPQKPRMVAGKSTATPPTKSWGQTFFKPPGQWRSTSASPPPPCLFGLGKTAYKPGGKTNSHKLNLRSD